MQLRNKTPKRLVKAELREGREHAVRPNDVCAMDFPQPWKSTDQAYYSEAFNGVFRTECLNAHWCIGLEDTAENLRLGVVIKTKAGRTALLETQS